MANNRIYWACASVSVAECGTNSFTLVHGAQSVGVTTRFNLEQVFELGQLEIYENIESVPDAEVTIEKVLDGYPLIYHLCTKGSTSASLAGRSTKRATVGLALFGDTQDSASGVPVAKCVLSGMYISSLNYTFPTQGNCTESVTLVGNNKTWSPGSFTPTSMNNDDAPLALNVSGGTQQRQDFLFGACDTSVAQPSASIMPTEIPGISASGTNNLLSDGSYSAKIQSVRVSANLGRDQLFQLGKRNPFFRYVNFPVSVNTSIEVLSTEGDGIDADENAASNVTDQRIWIRMAEGTKIDLGSRNKLQTVSMAGANAGAQGSNQTLTYEYLGFNTALIYHPQDPSGL